MIKSIEIENFRGFEKHQINFNYRTNLLVGKNNAGKSTVVEALRIAGIILERMNGLQFKPSPNWLAEYSIPRCVTPSIKNMDFSQEFIFHRYDSEHPAKITCIFHNNASLVIYIGNGFEICDVFFNAKGKQAYTRKDVEDLKITNISVLPQIRPLEKEEKILSTMTIEKGWSSNLASSHFRNQIKKLDNKFEEFKTIAEETWPGLQVLELETLNSNPESPIYLNVRDNDFVGEIRVMGHGLQMWLQTIWFLVRSSKSRTIILDEPDVYLHADLQRKLIRLLKSLDKQIIVATHSVEIMSEVQPEEIIIIDKANESSEPATTLPVVQKFIETLGGVHNLQLARMWSSKKCILVEGDDLTYLKEIHNKVYPNSAHPLDTVPNYAIGGWSSWKYAIGSKLLSKHTTGADVNIYCILDSDYHLEETLNERIEDANNHGIQIHIWKKKEIENYFLSSQAISRFIKSKAREGAISLPNPKEIESKINEIADNLKHDLILKIADAIQAIDRKLSPSSSSTKAEKIVEEIWKKKNQKLNKLSGKEIFSRLSEWSQQNFKVSISSYGVMKEMVVSEIDEEMRELIKNIEENKTLDNKTF